MLLALGRRTSSSAFTSTPFRTSTSHSTAWPFFAALINRRPPCDLGTRCLSICCWLSGLTVKLFVDTNWQRHRPRRAVRCRRLHSAEASAICGHSHIFVIISSAGRWPWCGSLLGMQLKTVSEHEWTSCWLRTVLSALHCCAHALPIYNRVTHSSRCRVVKDIESRNWKKSSSADNAASTSENECSAVLVWEPRSAYLSKEHSYSSSREPELYYNIAEHRRSTRERSFTVHPAIERWVGAKGATCTVIRLIIRRCGSVAKRGRWVSEVSEEGSGGGRGGGGFTTIFVFCKYTGTNNFIDNTCTQ